MKKAIKVIGQIVKWYLLLDVAYWSGIGASDACAEIGHRIQNHEELNTNNINDKVLNNAIENYKYFWRMLTQ